MQLNNDFLKKIADYLHLKESEKERKEIFTWYDGLSEGGETSDQEFNAAHIRNKARLFAAIQKTSTKPKMRKLFSYSAAAAAVLILGFFSYTYYVEAYGLQPLKNSELSTIMPKPESVIIKFSNGMAVNPDTIAAGRTVAIARDLYIRKNSSGTIQFVAQDNPDRTISSTLQTLQATQFSMVLSDGTEVYINANSRLTFPVAFDDGDRIVKLQGEAFFEVRKTLQHSKFFVRTADQTIKVLGTKFNVSAPKNALLTKTTLVEGSVSITPKNRSLKEVIIRPDQQAVLKDNGMDVARVDAAKVMSWKDGYFVFNGENTNEVLAEIGEWYNVNIENQHKGTAAEYTGKIPTNVSLGELLNLLNYSGIHVQAFKNKNGKPKLIIL